MKSFKKYIKDIQEEGPSNGTGLFTYGLGFFADTVPDDFDVENYAKLTDDGIKRTKLPWEVENAVNAERRQDMIVKWSKAAVGNNKQAVTKKSIAQVPNWQTAKR